MSDSFLHNPFDTFGFQPQWNSGNWTSAHGWTQIAGGLAVGVGCGLIFAVLFVSLRRRQSTPYPKLLGFLGFLILACGIIALLHALSFWWPAYRLIALLTAATGAIALAALAVLVSTLPKVLALRSPTEFQAEIAQRRRTELELRQVHAQLEGVIELRTAELASKNEEMEQFLNTVSHDLKSPVVTCVGLTGILRESLESGNVEDAKDSVNRIDRSINRMRQLIEDLLNLSRIGRVRFELADVDTNQMLSDIADELRPRLDKIGAVLKVEGNLPHVLADARWLTEVFENLINNAIKYGCDNPQPRISVGSVPHDDEHRFYVCDNGSGIDPAHHAQIFEPFKRLRSDKEGSGMGLAIVKRIVAMHGGDVWIESEMGMGATFWVALPVQKASVDKPLVPQFSRATT